MYIYNIEEFTEGVPRSVAGLYSKPFQAKQFYFSRLAINKCLYELNLKQKSKDISDLSIIDHHSLEFYPNILVSISHIQHFGAAVICSKKDYLGIGIDMELENRTINPKTAKLFLNDRDELQCFDNLLKSWTSKEAAFKALSPICYQYSSEQLKTVKDIWIQDGIFGLYHLDSPIGKIHTCVQEVKSSKVLICLALITI
ncbi:MAG: 4'-phosphopantetheinyl transferase superfamily protein [Bacteriovoracaceae bacterium]|nr:4'-phosphopantetheinyl transferase superfamily protein [Bacteriovoracaceae bacterium]